MTELHHIDIRLRPDPQTPEHELMHMLYAKLHRALVQLGSQRIAVAFPGYMRQPITLGPTLRLIGPEADLNALMALPWLGGMRDHATLSHCAPVPAGAPQRSLRRVQAKSSPARLRRRQMRRHGLTAEAAARAVPDEAAERLHLPFVALRSASTSQPFRLYFQLGLAQPGQPWGGFNSYGLNAQASLPWF